ncbi:MAG: hypothetical protein KGH75_06955 [Rhodospirillales bacterium]|nr:hypothetical protein [Rhodospirillales bacterium]
MVQIIKRGRVVADVAKRLGVRNPAARKVFGDWPGLRIACSLGGRDEILQFARDSAENIV